MSDKVPLSKLRQCADDKNPCIVRPSEARAILAYIEELSRKLEVGQRTSRARKLSFDAAMSKMEDRAELSAMERTPPTRAEG